MKIDEIKNLLKSGNVAGAEAAANRLLAKDPYDVRAMMLYGTCRQLQGDEVAFRRIHRKLAPKMAKIADGETQAMWRKFDDMNKELRDLRARGRDSLEVQGHGSRCCPVYGCAVYPRVCGLGCLLAIVGTVVGAIVYWVWKLCVK